MSKTSSLALGLALLLAGCGGDRSSGPVNLRTSRRPATAALGSAVTATTATASTAVSSGILAAPATTPATGTVPAPVSFAVCDAAVEDFMRARSIPGGSLAVVKDGRLVHMKGFGVADRTTLAPVQPRSLFRLASVSKHLTAVAVMQLVERGLLTLDTKAFSLLPHLPVFAGYRQDPRLASITVRQLLDHTAGWDWDASDDPMFQQYEIARAIGLASPANPEAIVRYVRGSPLDYTPGSKHVYANIDFCILGRIIERLTGLSYETYVQRNVLAPCGVKNMHLGRTFARDALPFEVAYYQDDEGVARNVFDPTGPRVPWAYGGYSLEALDSAGGWVASAPDLARVEAALGSKACPVLSQGALATLLARPAGAPGLDAKGALADEYHAGGTFVETKGHGGVDHVHDGSLSGTATYFVRRGDGVAWVVLFNQRSNDDALPDWAIEASLNDAIDKLPAWPAGDLFPTAP